MDSFGRAGDSHNLSMAIVGLPNIGKSSLFNILTNLNAKTADYLFCTIDPNIGFINYYDKKLEDIATIYKSKACINSPLKIVDIAGLIKGANQGVGLGNEFLESIRRCDGIFHVLRCFSGDVVHCEGVVDPLRDALVVNSELCLKDLYFVNNSLSRLERESRAKDKNYEHEKLTLKKVQNMLEDLLKQYSPENALKLLQAKKEIPSTQTDTNSDQNSTSTIQTNNVSIQKTNNNNKNNKDDVSTPSNASTLTKKQGARSLLNPLLFTETEIKFINSLNLLTTKKMVYLANMSASDFVARKTGPLKKLVKVLESQIIPFSIEHLLNESGPSNLNSTTTNNSQENIQKSKVKLDFEKLIVEAGYSATNLIKYYTAGEKETRAWTIRKDTPADKAGGVIHTDFEKLFVMAEVVRYDDLINLGNENEVRKAGLLKQRGRQYIVQDADIINFKISKPKKSKSNKNAP